MTCAACLFVCFSTICAFNKHVLTAHIRSGQRQKNVIIYGGKFMIRKYLQQILRRKYPPAGRFMRIDSVWMHYVELLPEHYDAAIHPTVVFIHGLSGSVYDFLLSPLMEKINNRYRILCIDRPGAGYSYIIDGRQYTLEMQIDTIKKLLEELSIQRAIIVGHSLGGALALLFALRYPDFDARFLLLAPLIYPVWLMYFPLLFLLRFGWIRWLVFRCVLYLQTIFFHQLIRNAFRPNASLLRPDYEALTRDQLSSWPQLYAEFYNLMSVKDSLLRHMPCYRHIERPVIILAGKHDKIIPAARHSLQLSRLNPHVRVKVYSRVGHMINFALADEIAHYLDELAEQRAR